MENGMNNNEITSCEEMIMNTFSYIEKSTLEKNNKFYAAWKSIITKISGCGQNLYEHSKIVEIKNGIMLIETDHPGWNQMFQMHKKFILNGLKMYIPEMNVKTLAFRVKGSAATLCDYNYENQLKKENLKEQEMIKKQETVLKKYEKVDDKKNTFISAKKDEIPQEISNMFESMKQTMLTKNKNK